MGKTEYADIHNYEKRLNQIMARIESHPNLTKDTIQKALDWKRQMVLNDLKLASICKNMEKLLRLGYFFPKKKIKDFTKADIDDVVEQIMEPGKYSDETRALHKRILRMFFKFCGKEQIVEHVKSGVRKFRQKIPEELLSEEDILQIVNSCENHRDRALITMLYETGARIGEIGSLRLKDIEFKDGEGTLVLSGKTGMRKVLIQFCVPYLKKYLEVHRKWNNSSQNPTDKNSFLFMAQGKEDEGKPFPYDSIRIQIQKIVKRAGINKPCNPHHFRHSRASYLAQHLTEAQLCYIMGWEQGSDMPRTYIHLSGKAVYDSLREIYGGKPKQLKQSVLTIQTCTICNESNEPNSQICQKCNNPLTVQGAVEKSSKITQLETTLKVMDKVLERMDKLEKLEKLVDKLFTDKEAKELLEKITR